MFYRTKLKDFIRVPPAQFKLELKDAITQSLKGKYDGYISKDIGIVIDVGNVFDIGEGKLIPGDGAPFYPVEFELFTFKPELQECVLGKIKDIADFGAFINLGPAEGMIHISQTMDDYVSFAKDKVLQSRDSKKALKVGDLCRARVIAVSYKDLSNPKLGLTMRQEGLGKLEWLDESNVPKEAAAPAKKEAKGKK